MKFRDYYEVMGVPRTATAEQIKSAYRRLARKYHPDVSKEPDAEAKFKELQEANEVLKDPEKRAAYDQLGQNWRAGQEFRPPPDWGQNFNFGGAARGGRRSRARGGEGPADFSDFFSELFGGGGPFRGTQGGGARERGFAASGQDHVARVEIELEDAYRGSQRMVELNATEVTPEGDVVIKPRSLRVIDSRRRHARTAHPAGRPGRTGFRRRIRGRPLSRDRAETAPAVRGRRPQYHGHAARRTLGGRAGRNGCRADARRAGGDEAARRRGLGAEAAPAWTRPARQPGG